MSFTKYKHIYRSIAILIAFLVVSAILWNTYSFFQQFKKEERTKMEILAQAQQRMAKLDPNADTDLELLVLQSNLSIPMILVDAQGNIKQSQNLDTEKENDSIYLKEQLAIMKRQNEPIVINYDKGKQDLVYYRNSDLLFKLQYYPLALLLIFFLFGSVIYLFFRSNAIAEQNRLWSGMAKETAHQIGTPLTSLLGWVEILRMENVEKDTVNEIEKDVHRLNTIAERFSKIGSIPKLQKQNIVALTKSAFAYLESRSSKKVEFKFNTANEVVNVNLNEQLYGWVIENLVKNAIDAMDGKGKIKIDISTQNNQVLVRVKDSGKGMRQKVRKQIFTPGFTTKTRGWGLGLSLSKRIIEDYHNGKISVEKSEIGKGTTFLVKMNVV